jgi:hypothetical protein
MFKLAFSLILIGVLAISISRKVRLSTRYERAPRRLSTWNSLDKGIDPTEDAK